MSEAQDPLDANSVAALERDVFETLDSAFDQLTERHTTTAERGALAALRATLRAAAGGYLGFLGANAAAPESLTAAPADVSSEAPPTTESEAADDGSDAASEAASEAGSETDDLPDFRRLVAAGAISSEHGARLLSFLSDRRTLIVFGRRDSGARTLVNSLFTMVSVDERFVAIDRGDDLPALRNRSFSVHLQVEADADVPAVFKKARRMKPSRLVLGTLGGPETHEFFDFLAGPPATPGLTTLDARTVGEAIHVIVANYGDAKARDILADLDPIFVQVDGSASDPHLASLWTLTKAGSGELIAREA